MEIIEKFQEETNSLAVQATGIKVYDEPSYIAAGEFAKGIKDLKKRIIDYFKPLKEAAYKAHKAITQKESDELLPLEQADGIVRLAMTNYLERQHQAQLAKQAELDSEAKKAAEIKKERLLKQAVKAA